MDTERNPIKNITAGASLDWARDPELVEGQRAQRITFLFVGRRRQTKTFFKLELEVLPNRRLPIGQKEFPQRALRLCGEMSESLSAIIGETLRLKLFGCLAQPKADPSQPKADPSFGGLWRSLGAKNYVEVVLLTILW